MDPWEWHQPAYTELRDIMISCKGAQVLKSRQLAGALEIISALGSSNIAIIPNSQLLESSPSIDGSAGCMSAENG
jgi:hypothetical protein